MECGGFAKFDWNEILFRFVYVYSILFNRGNLHCTRADNENGCPSGTEDTVRGENLNDAVNRDCRRKHDSSVCGIGGGAREGVAPDFFLLEPRGTSMVSRCPN